MFTIEGVPYIGVGSNDKALRQIWDLKSVSYNRSVPFIGMFTKRSFTVVIGQMSINGSMI